MYVIYIYTNIYLFLSAVRRINVFLWSSAAGRLSGRRRRRRRRSRREYKISHFITIYLKAWQI